MIATYHLIALKYKKSVGFSKFTRKSKIFLVTLHVFIVITNILLYFWFIYRDFNQVSFALEVFGLIIFVFGLFIIFWGIYSLMQAVFIPENKLIAKGAFAFVRHPIYLGGVTGAFGLALFAGSPLALAYSLILAGVLSYIADAEEEELLERFGKEYAVYREKVPKLFPRFRDQI